jgi:hypothetical protein
VKSKRRVALVMLISALLGVALVVAACAGEEATTITQAVTTTQAVLAASALPNWMPFRPRRGMSCSSACWSCRAGVHRRAQEPQLKALATSWSLW